jgi:hypothetical protein
MPGYWTPESEPVDSVIVSGVPLPGFSEPVGSGCPRKIQYQAGPGFSGMRALFWGMDIVHFSILVHLQDEQDLFDWEAFKATPVGAFVKPPVSKGGGMMGAQAAVLTPYVVYHPFLAEVGIFSVTVDDVLQAVREGETGSWMHEIKVTKYQPLKRQSAVYTDPKGAAPDERDQRNLDQQAANNQKRASLAALQNTHLPAPQ